MHRDLQNTGLIHLDLGLHLNPSRVTPAFKGSHRPAQRLKTITTTRAVQEWLLSKSAFGHHFRCCDDGETKDTRHDFRYSMMLLTRLWLGNMPISLSNGLPRRKRRVAARIVFAEPYKGLKEKLMPA